MTKEEKDFLDAINGVNTVNEKPRFRGTGVVGKATRENIWASNKEQYQQEAGQFGKSLAMWVKQERANDLTKSKEDIIQELKKEGKI